VLDRILGPSDVQCPTIESDATAVLVVRADDGTRQLGATCPDETGEAQHLTPPQAETDVVEHTPTLEVLDPEELRPNGGALLLAVDLFDLPADHHGDEHLFRDVGDRLLVDELAVAHHHDLIGDLEDLGHLVRDVDKGRPLGLEPADDVEELRRLRLGQRRCGLVEQQHLRSGREGLEDLEHLPLPHGQALDESPRVDVQVELAEEVTGVPVELAPSDLSGRAGGLPVGEDVLCHR